MIGETASSRADANSSASTSSTSWRTQRYSPSRSSTTSTASARRRADQRAPGQDQRRPGDAGHQRREDTGSDEERGGAVPGPVPPQAAQLGRVRPEHHVGGARAEPEAGGATGALLLDADGVE